MKISVIVPVYNSEKYLKRCLDSIIASQIREVKNEIILINDGSTDTSLEICYEYKNNHSNIIVLTQDNKGPSAARNNGLKIARGEYITFVDSDDYVDEKYFHTINKHLNSNLDIIVFGHNKIKADTSSIYLYGSRILNKNQIFEQIVSSSLTNIFWFPHNKVYNKKVVRNLFFDESIRIGEDTIFNIEAFYNANKIRIIDYALYNYVETEGSLTQVKYNSDLLINMENHYNARVNIHENKNDLNSIKVQRDIAQYYINHILFWLLNNLKNSPSGFEVKEAEKIRNSLVYKNTFCNYNYKGQLTFKMRLIVFFFKRRMFNILKLAI